MPLADWALTVPVWVLAVSRRTVNVALVAPAFPSITLTSSIERDTVPAGGTISRIVFDHYGRHSSLALDLIHELNPELQDLDVVAAGQTLRLPPLNMEGLLRRQPDGSYRLVVGSYPSQAAATELARTIREHGYTASVRTREVTSEQVLHRVQIDGLATRAVALRAWETANRLEWLDVRRDGPDRAAPGRSRPSARR